MAKKPNHPADIENSNEGTSGTNKTYDQNQGNRGKQLAQKQLTQAPKKTAPAPKSTPKKK